MTEKLARTRESKLKYHGNAIRELKTRIGLEGIYPAPVLSNNDLQKNNISSTKINNHKTKSVKTGAGFTLIEILVVMGLTVMLAGLGLLFSLDFYRSYAFNSERQLIISLLQKARSGSMSNINQTNYGLCVNNGNYILFTGSVSCDPNNNANEVYPAHPGVTSSPTTFTVSFAQLRGNPTFTNGDNVTLNYTTAHTANISINAEGRINW